VLAYLSRYTHRVASRLIAAGNSGITFKYKDYCNGGCDGSRREVDEEAGDKLLCCECHHLVSGGPVDVPGSKVWPNMRNGRLFIVVAVGLAI
jgi:hypothetical protein